MKAMRALCRSTGSPMRLINKRGSEHEFGNNTSGKSKTLNPFTFKGYQLDSISDTLFAQAREYMSDMGRFVSEDLIKGYGLAPKTLNQYTYCWNQPIDLVDLDGRIPRWLRNLFLSEDNQFLIDYAIANGVPWHHLPDVWFLGNEASQSAYDRAWRNGITGTNRYGVEIALTQGNEIDAYRHFQWMFRIAQRFDPATARVIGDSNEILGLYGYGGQMLWRNDIVVVAYFNDFTLQDLWNNSVAFTMGADQALELCSDENSSPFIPPLLTPPITGFGHPPRISNSHNTNTPPYYCAFQYVINNGLIMENRSDVGRFFGIELDQTTYREIREGEYIADPAAIGVWNLQNNTITFTGPNNQGITINLYTDPINGPIGGRN